MKKALEPFLGFILSIASWEQWENLIIAVLVALLGGFAGSLGKSLHLYLKACLANRKTRKSNANSISE